MLLVRKHCCSLGVSATRRKLSSATSRPAESVDDTAAAALSIPDPRNQRILHAAVAGLPNAGKSTLLNYMVADKVGVRRLM